MKITEKTFGSGYQLITLTNSKGTSLSVTDLGARITSWQVPTSDGLREIVLGFDSAEEYLTKDAFIGASIGRIAGRIENGRFTIGHQEYQTTVNPENGHALHSAPTGFELAKWSYEIAQTETEASVTFTHHSPDMENQFPGNLSVAVTYTLTEDNTWRLTTKAKSDKDTLFNPTNHVYFNLSGDVTQSVKDHILTLNSSYFAPLRPDVIPLGEKRSVAGTPLDFRTGQKLATVFDSAYEEVKQFNGLDHPFFIDNTERPAAHLVSGDEEVKLTVTTDTSSLVIFSANFGEDGPEMHGQKLADHGGITFEAQTAPGADQFPEFGSLLLKAEESFYSVTEFKI